MTGVALASIAAEREWGLFHHLDSPYWMALVVSVVALDFNRYIQHLLLHKVPFLWRMHRLHHSDGDFDFTTQLRFHPLEAVFSAAAISLFIIALGVSPSGVILYTLLTASLGFLQHGNVRYAERIEPLARSLIVTPEMHRIHHSAVARESNRNFGSILSWWDRLFGTYVAEPAKGHEAMVVGLSDYTSQQSMALPLMLADPFLSTSRPVN